MMKKNKKKESWECGDCGQVYTDSRITCSGPQHELGEELFRMRMRAEAAEAKVSELTEARNTWCMTLNEFTDVFTNGLKEQLIRLHGENGSKHPVDLATTTLLYAEAFAAIFDSIDWYSVTGAEKPKFLSAYTESKRYPGQDDVGF